MVETRRGLLLRRGWLLLLIGVGVFLGLSGYTFYYAQGASYLSNDPRACVNCHVMREQYDSWTKSSHHAVATCNDCHIPHELPGKLLVKMENGYVHSAAFTFQNFHEPIRIRPRTVRVLENNCLHCHGDFVSHLLEQDVAAGPSGGEVGRSCVGCHLTVGHAAIR